MSRADLREIHRRLWRKYRDRLPHTSARLVIFTDNRGYQGQQTDNPETGALTVEVLDDGDMQHAVAVLVHEWGHVLAWGAHDEMHGPIWGVAYAEVFREVYERKRRGRSK